MKPDAKLPEGIELKHAAPSGSFSIHNKFSGRFIGFARMRNGKWMVDISQYDSFEAKDSDATTLNELRFKLW